MWTRVLNIGAGEAASSPRCSHTPHPGLVRPSPGAHQTLLGCTEAPVLSGASEGLFWGQGLGPNAGTHTAEAHPWSQASGTHIDCIQLQAIFQLLCCFPSSLPTHHHSLCKDKCTAPLPLGVFPDERHSLLQHILVVCRPQAGSVMGPVSNSGNSRALPPGHSQREPCPVPRGARPPSHCLRTTVCGRSLVSELSFLNCEEVWKSFLS